MARIRATIQTLLDYISYWFYFRISNILMNRQLEKQNFHEVEVTSGFIMKLIKQTQENIRLGKQTIKEKGNNVYNRLSKPKN